MTEKRVLIAAAISVAFMAVYGQWLSQRYPQTTRSQPPALAAPAQPVLMSEVALDEEPVVRLDGEGVTLELGERSGAIRRAILQDFLDHEKKDRAHFGSQAPVFRVLLPDPSATWTLVDHDDRSANFRAEANGKQYNISYTCCDPKYVVNIDLQGDFSESKIVTTWARADEMSGGQNVLEAVTITRASAEAAPKYKKMGPAGKTTRNVPRGTFQLTLSERYFCQSLKFSTPVQAAIVPAPPLTIQASATLPPGANQLSAQLYIGPRDFFYLRGAGFHEAFKVGILGQIGLIMLWIISSLAGVTKSYGAAVILFAAGITSLMAPFTLMGYRSMKRMQELKPQMDAITAKHKNDPQRANKEVFALYREHKVSPMSGCLPMLLQLPIFIALFQAMSHFIKLRGESFLWIKDLSLPDRLFVLPFSIPLLGNEVNLLPIIMAGAMYLQSKLTQSSMPSAESNPSAKLMQGPMMSVIFGFMFYHFPSGLVLYWLFNSLTSMAWYRLAK